MKVLLVLFGLLAALALSAIFVVANEDFETKMEYFFFKTGLLIGLFFGISAGVIFYWAVFE